MPRRSMLLAALFTIAFAEPVGAQSLRRVFERVNPAVVVVHTEMKASQAAADGRAGSAAKGVGSGVVVSDDGRILTAAHVVQAARRVEVEFLDGQRWTAQVIASAPFADLALLKLTTVPENLAVATLGDSDRVRPGDPVFAVGAPLGAGHSLAVGHVSARRNPEKIFENLTALELFQVDMALFHGNSGGPVFDLEGQVVGIVSGVLTVGSEGTHGPGFAVTANVARKLMIEGKRPWIGVEAQLIDGPLADAFNLPQSAGLLVQSVAEGSLAARLGLREGTKRIVIDERELWIGGDTILEMLGLVVRSDPSVLREIEVELDRLGEGGRVTMKVLRRGAVVDLSAKIGD